MMWLLGLDRLDRRAGGDAAHDRHRDRAAAVVLRARPHPAEIALDHARREAARAARADAVRDRFGQLDHLDGAGPIGQAADEAALLQRRDEPVNAGFRAQIERILHLVEGRRHTGLLQALVDETQKFGLLSGQHVRFPVAAVLG